MATFVLVHGGQHGGWCWKRTAPLLRAQGHTVYTPTLTGVGERRHLLTNDITILTHVQDVVNVMEFEELSDVVLVGHSYAGALLPGIAVAASHRLRHIVWLDADVLNEGESVFESLGVANQKECEQALNRVRSGEWGPLGPKESKRPNMLRDWDPLFDISDEGLLRWVLNKVTGHPVATMVEPLVAPGFDKLTVPNTYISCTESKLQKGLFPKWGFSERARQRGWPVIELAVGHDLMVTHPELLAGVLDTIAYRR